MCLIISHPIHNLIPFSPLFRSAFHHPGDLETHLIDALLTSALALFSFLFGSTHDFQRNTFSLSLPENCNRHVSLNVLKHLPKLYTLP